MKNYNEIENRLQKHYDGLLSAVKAPDTNKKIQRKTTAWENVKYFFDSTGFQAAAAALALIFTVGGVYGFIFYFSGKNLNPDPVTPVTSADTTVPDGTGTAAETMTEEEKAMIVTLADVYGKENPYYGLCAGDGVQLRIDLKNVSDLASISITVSWDERLELLYAEYAQFFFAETLHINDEDKELWDKENAYTFEWISSGTAITGACTFVDLMFGTPENTASTFDITITANTDKILDSNGQKIPVTVKSAPIETVYRTLSETMEYETAEPETTEPETTEPETTEPETTEPETTEPETSEPETTEPVTEAEKEPEKGREFKSVQSSHETPQELENPTNMYTSNPYNAHPGGGIYGGKASYIAFKVLDCGYEQFESIKAFQGQSLPSDTFDMREKLAAGKLKFWLCDLDGNKIDYVYANGNGIVAFEMYPGEYRITYEDDGIYKTNYSSIIRVYEAEGGGTYYMIYDSVDKVGDNAYVGIYNYQKYKPVTIRITDDITGEPLKGVNVGYQIQYLNDDIEYMKTDDYGQIKLNSIFDIMLYQNPGSVGSWHSDIMLYFEKDGYDRFGIKTDNVTETTLEVQLHKTEYFEYTVKVLDKETGEPIKGAKLEWNSSVNGEFIIDESGDDGILKGIMYSSSLSDLYGDTRVSPHVSVSYVCKTARYNYQAQKDVPLYKGVYDFTLLFTNVDTREPEGEFELVLSE